MKRWVKWGVAVLALAVFGALVARSLVARRGAAAPSAAPPAELAFRLAPSDVLTVAPVELVRTVSVSGGLKAVDSAVVKARVAAVVQDLTVREGDVVKRGQLLGHLDAAEFTLRLRQAEEQATAAKSQLDLAERTLANNRALVAQGFISQNALDTSVMNAAGARASLQAAQAAADLARKSLNDAQIHAPLDGSVSQRFVQPGERVLGRFQLAHRVAQFGRVLVHVRRLECGFEVGDFLLGRGDVGFEVRHLAVRELALALRRLRVRCGRGRAFTDRAAARLALGARFVRLHPTDWCFPSDSVPAKSGHAMRCWEFTSS